MKVLMLGWEFPPFISGGLGTACYGLTRAMSKLGTEVVFVLPKAVPAEYSSHVKIASPSKTVASRIAANEVFPESELENVIFRTVPSALQPYQRPENYQEVMTEMGLPAEPGFETFEITHQQVTTQEVKQENSNGGQVSGHYGGDLYSEVHRYARLATQIARDEEFDVIHAHDWMTYPAGLAVAAMTGKPLVVHIHSTEFDRSGENVNQMIYDIERQGLHGADKIIAVSCLTRDVVVARYGINAKKVSVVYNAIERNGSFVQGAKGGIAKDEKIVLFLGRITMQKGPEYFIAAAKKVLEVMDNVKFVMAGSGDMVRRTIELAAEMGIGHKVLFTGFLRGDDVDKVFRMADLFVMPSVSEPFGLVPLEALRNDVPVLISKQSGVSEILTHVLKVDFWDVNEMANKIVAVLRHPPLHATLREHGNFEVRKLSWDDAAQRCVEVYESLFPSLAPTI
ncbi:MAG: glycosyltransferase [Phycisphaerae bacterium]|nr:glycosyltransferase [Phycisphaerae bacterium]